MSTPSAKPRFLAAAIRPLAGSIAHPFLIESPPLPCLTIKMRRCCSTAAHDRPREFLSALNRRRGRREDLGPIGQRKLLDSSTRSSKCRDCATILAVWRALQRAGEDSLKSKRQSGQTFGCLVHSFNPLRGQLPLPIAGAGAAISAVHRDAVTHEV